VLADRAQRVPQHLVASGVTLSVVDSFQAHDIDVANDESAGRSTGTLDLVIKVDQPRRARARPGQRVGLSDRQLCQQRFVICLSLQAVTSRLLAITGRLVAITGRLLAICRSPGSTLERRYAISRGKLAVLPCTQQDLNAGHRAPVARPHCVAHSQLTITQRGRLVARQSRQIAGLRYRVALSPCVNTTLGSLLTHLRVLLASPGTLIANLARKVVLRRVSAAREIAVGGSLIGVGRSLITLGGDLVAIGCALVSIGERLIPVGERLIAVRERLIPVRERLIALERASGRSGSVRSPVDEHVHIRCGLKQSVELGHTRCWPLMASIADQTAPTVALRLRH
jgi:hypothetical protein